MTNSTTAVEATIDISEKLENFPAESSSLIPLLQATQQEHGYLPRSAMEQIGEHLGIPPSKVHSVATFYAQFRFEPLGDHLIKVCHGTACHVKGANAITETLENHLGVQEGETTDDGQFTLERVACLGCCSLAPCMMVDDTVYGQLTRDKAKNVVKKYRKGDQ